MNLPILGAVYHQGRNDIWAMTPREMDAYLTHWVATQKTVS